MNIKFKKGAADFGYYGSEDFWYALFDGGYIVPENLLEDQTQIDFVRRAMALLADLKQQMEENNLLQSS